jgi:hypothetical protein
VTFLRRLEIGEAFARTNRRVPGLRIAMLDDVRDKKPEAVIVDFKTGKVEEVFDQHALTEVYGVDEELPPLIEEIDEAVKRGEI